MARFGPLTASEDTATKTNGGPAGWKKEERETKVLVRKN